MIKKQKFILTIRFFTYGKFGLIFIYQKIVLLGMTFFFIILFKTPIEQKLGVFSHMENIYV
ncbi:hypothetical protein EFE32_02080 [Lactococcus lactis subsp. lactis]|jgi:hypothetical protein|uniref:Uncharacterized protein n=1 Tax=Lactococcus lactis subsp. lactis TaxID=1360 RepID=A0A0V8CSB8_LACLL|nr:hypothetical protein KF282_1608 [Lactococcus lactis subsp. lactis]MCT0015661.1 hypothetical protein [Lactococcus lactis subsp. lactis]